MSGGKEARVDLQELCAAYADYSPDNRYYLDLETGEVLYLSEFMDEGVAEELESRIVEGCRGRYVSVPCESSGEGYRDMEDFIVTVVDAGARERLFEAISGRGAFRRFRDVLLDYPELRERWFGFKDGRVLERVHEWLESEGIDVPGEECN